MNRRKTITSTCVFFCVALICSTVYLTKNSSVDTLVYKDAIDAISVNVQADTIHTSVRALVDNTWTDWKEFEFEKEFDPNLQESDLVIFDEAVHTIQIKSKTAYKAHPLRLENTDPPSYEVAALVPNFKAPKILSRNQWGADESLLFSGATSTRTDVKEDTTTKSNRVVNCEEMQKKYPHEFRITKTIKADRNGRPYRWPQKFSNKVTHIVVHHTAEKSTGDKRLGWERMRLLYKFHANSRGWGDVGYNYVIDSDGQIYEGRAGGKYVIGGHAFCNNTGSIGIAMMGNFEVEKPTQAQMLSLQWLTVQLADDYNIDLSRPRKFRGEVRPAVIGHRDVTATACPGHYAYSVLDQVRNNTSRGRFRTEVRFAGAPSSRGKKTRGSAGFSRSNGVTLQPSGSTDIMGRPGSFLNVSIKATANDLRVNKRERIATVSRSDNRIGIWQKYPSGKESRIRKELIAPKALKQGQSTVLQLRIQVPREAGIYTMTVGSVPFVITADGRRVGASKSEPIRRITNAASTGTPQRSVTRSVPRMSLVRRAPITRQSTRSTTPAWTPDRETIRIKLSHTGKNLIVTVGGNNSTVDGTPLKQYRIDLHMQGDKCVASSFGRKLAEGTPRIISGNGVVTLTSSETSLNRFRGVIECRVEDGTLILVNELPLEMYMAGLAEEPDSEPYEKQRAFAIAARSYAAHYMSPNNRKFPGKPYDGNDSPAYFQKYGGVLFEEKNPRWVEAVKSTSKQVIKKNGFIVKTPYFSSDSGRTNSPKDAGWNRFPFEEVFQSKPDPWCEGMIPRGHGVGMSGCGAKGQALEGKTAEQILEYYYPTTKIERF